MAPLVPSPPPDKKRVKVYELRNNDWFDRGTGFCTASFAQTDDGQEGEPQVNVNSEEDPDQCILLTTITKDDGFQKQQDTLIVWTDPRTGVDMALSFQEAEGCSMIWKFIAQIQSTFPQEEGLDDDLSMGIDQAPSVSLPNAELGKLNDIDQTLRFHSQQQHSREGLSKFITTEDYLPKLISVFNDAEDFQSLQDLHILCNIMKQIILLNDNYIIEQIVSDECIDGVIGALEYDPDFPTQKALHRKWLNGQDRFREVVKIADERIECKIHQTYRLQYLKDVVLARILDDATFSVLNSLIFFNQVEIVQHIQNDAEILSDLFSVFNPSSSLANRRRDAVMFIQQCCSIAKNLEPPSRISLYNNFIAHGLLKVVNYGLKHPDVSIRVGAVEIMSSMIDHDAQMVRNTMYRQVAEGQPLLIDSLIDLLLVETDLGVKNQLSETIRVLLDTVVANPAPIYTPQMMRLNPEVAQQLRQRSQADPLPAQEDFIQHFYQHSAGRLFKPLMTLDEKETMEFTLNEAALFNYLIEILIFFLRQHKVSKEFVFKHNFTIKLTRLFETRQKHLQLIPIRLVRHMLAMKQEVCLKHLIARDVFTPILELLQRILPRDNLVSSACFDVFDFINRDKINTIAKYLVENHRQYFEAPDMKNYHAFRTMLNNYEASKAFTQPLPLTNYDKIMQALFRSRQSPELSQMPDTLENMTADSMYINVPDSDLDNDEAVISPLSADGSLPAHTGLVDYHSDEESDENPDLENIDPSQPNLDLDVGGDHEDSTCKDEGSTEKAGKEATATASAATASAVATAPVKSQDETDESLSNPATPEAEPREEAPAPATPEQVSTPPANSDDLSDSTPSPSTPPTQTVTPPERSSEKRRRDEDDEEELSTTIKRRLSSSSVSSTASAKMLRHKKSFAANANGGGPNKIGMNVTQAPVTTGGSGGSDTE